jgi:hypothetical protein
MHILHKSEKKIATREGLKVLENALRVSAKSAENSAHENPAIALALTLTRAPKMTRLRALVNARSSSLERLWGFKTYILDVLKNQLLISCLSCFTIFLNAKRECERKSFEMCERILDANALMCERVPV